VVQGILPVGLHHFLHLASHPADNGKTETLGIPQEFGAQSAANQGVDPLFPQHLQSLGGLQVRQIQFLARITWRWVFREDLNPGTPVQHRCNPATQYRYGQHADIY